jgi:hypothetical protein
MSLIPAGPWHEQPEFWDRITLADRQWPGLATVEVSRANKWDSKKAKGSHGQEREFSGVDAAKVKIRIRIWTSEQWAEITSDLLPTIEPSPEKAKVDSITIGHAVASARKVQRITVDVVKGPSEEADGTWAIDIDATEYRAPATKNATGTATGKGTGGGNPAPGSVCDQLKEQMVFLSNKLNAALAKQAEILGRLNNNAFWIEWPFLQTGLGVAEQEIAQTQAEIADVAARQQQEGCGNAQASASPQIVGP